MSQTKKPGSKPGFFRRSHARSTKFFGRSHQFVRYPGLERGMSRVGNDAQFGLRPRAMQIPRTAQWAHDIVATLHGHTGTAADLLIVEQQLIAHTEKPPINEVMRFDTRDAELKFIGSR